MDAVDPAPAQVSQRGQVCFLGQHLGLKAAHLARGGRTLGHSPAPHDPTHARITAKPVGVVDVLVAGQSPKHGLPDLSDQCVTAILAGPGVSENFSGKLGQAEHVIEIPKREQTSVGGDLGAVEFQLQAGIKRDPKSNIIFFTRCTAHLRLRCATYSLEG